MIDTPEISADVMEHANRCLNSGPFKHNSPGRREAIARALTEYGDQRAREARAAAIKDVELALNIPCANRGETELLERVVWRIRSLADIYEAIDERARKARAAAIEEAAHPPQEETDD